LIAIAAFGIDRHQGAASAFAKAFGNSNGSVRGESPPPQAVKVEKRIRRRQGLALVAVLHCSSAGPGSPLRAGETGANF
jgi:hypothetical protein